MLSAVASSPPAPTPMIRSPLPLLAGGIAVALLVIALATLPARQRVGPDPSQRETLSEREALTLVAREMRSGEAAIRVLTEGQARFDDGSWFVQVGEARFRLSELNRIVWEENDAARALRYQDERAAPPR